MKPTAGDNFLTYFGVNAQSPRVGGKNQDVELDRSKWLYEQTDGTGQIRGQMQAEREPWAKVTFLLVNPKGMTFLCF